jgi:cytochrome c biogenesis protein CcdA
MSDDISHLSPCLLSLTPSSLFLSQGKAGNAAQYITRNQALKKLQLKLSEFR